MHILASSGVETRMSETPGHILNPGWPGDTWACQRLLVNWKDTLEQMPEGCSEQSEILKDPDPS